METTTFRTHWARSSRSAKGLLVATLAVGAWALSSAAHASDVYWSVGVNQPGLSVGVSNARPVYVQPAPVYVQPAPVYVQPQPVYVQPRPVYVQPRPVVIHQPAYQYVRPVVMAPQPVYVHPGWSGHGHWKDRDDRRGGRGHGHRHGGRDWDDSDRHGRR